jgi:hypothetical protein
VNELKHGCKIRPAKSAEAGTGFLNQVKIGSNSMRRRWAAAKKRGIQRRIPPSGGESFFKSAYFLVIAKEALGFLANPFKSFTDRSGRHA